jgi:hypothetical protein
MEQGLVVTTSNVDEDIYHSRLRKYRGMDWKPVVYNSIQKLAE